MVNAILTYRFLPWLRRGLAEAIGPSDNQSRAPRVQLPVSLSVNTSQVNVAAHLYGPGDVVGLDPNQIVRTEPKPLSSDFEPNYFPFIEFVEPTLPWLFTPLSSRGTEQLTPWLCLVVVSEGEGVTYSPTAGNQIATLTVADPKRHLPDLAESWAWAHTQVIWVAGADPEQLLQGAGHQVVSRLLSPRRLEHNTKYRACVVPTFEAGRQAGLGLPVTVPDLQPAWDLNANAPVTMPVYYDWQFTAGPAGDFASLLQDLLKNPRRPDDLLGSKSVDATKPGFGLNAGSIKLEGALCMPAEESTGIDDTDSALDTDEPCAGGTPPPLDFQRQLEKILNIAAGATPESLHAPIVGPPIYAAQYAGLSTLPGEGQPPLWLRDLNLDPRYRVAASLGAMVVHHQQEQLLASAWDQLAQARRVNQTLRQLQAAREVSRAVHTAHLKPLAQHQLWQLTRAAHSRVMPTGATTLEAQVRASRLPEGALAPTVRRLARPQGPLVRRRTLTTNPTAAAPEEPLPLVESMNVPNGLLAAPPRQAPSGTISMTAVRNVGYAPASPDSVRSASGWATWDSTGTGSPTAGESKALPGARNGGPEDGGAVRWADPLDYRIPRPPLILKTYFDQMTANFRSAATLCQQYLERIETQLAVPPVDPPPVASDRQALLGQLHPDLTVHSAATDRITTEINIWRRRDKLDPVTAAPQYSYPMWEPLADLSPEWLLPNLEAVPDPAVAVLTCNSRFLEAYVAGLNHALGKEFLWRDFPSHQVATYFRSFWQEGRPDIPDFEEWDGRGLGEHAVAPALVLLVRSALLARYPTASISAVPAAVVDGVRVPSGNELTPLLRVTVKPDIALAGFDLSPAAATGQDGGQGWFFVIEQHVTEPRFGLEPPQSSDFGQAPVDWAHFSWGNLATAPDQLAMLTYASARQAVLATNAGGLAWGPGSDSGNVAAITLRKPVRVAIHASAILPVPQGPGSGSQ